MIITLTTDFGTRDPFVGLVKGVILSIAPSVTVVDLCHEVPPHDIETAALMLEAVAAVFPHDTIHVAVVDPDVGSERRALAVETAEGRWIAPDNGILSAVLTRCPPGQAVVLTDPAFHRHPVSATFHGRDIFAAAAAYLARGTRIEQLGPEAGDLVHLELPKPRTRGADLELHVVLADHFGNLITDLDRETYDRWRTGTRDATVTLTVADRVITGISRTYGDAAPRQLLAYFGSTDRLEIAVNRGSAAQELAAVPGAALAISISRANPSRRAADGHE